MVEGSNLNPDILDLNFGCSNAKRTQKAHAAFHSILVMFESRIDEPKLSTKQKWTEAGSVERDHQKMYFTSCNLVNKLFKMHPQGCQKIYYPDINSWLFCICIGQSLSHSLSFVITGPGSNWVDVTPVVFGLGVNLKMKRLFIQLAFKTCSYLA